MRAHTHIHTEENIFKMSNALITKWVINKKNLIPILELKFGKQWWRMGGDIWVNLLFFWKNMNTLITLKMSKYAG